MGRRRRRDPRMPHYDVVVVGSGFGGSVAALRLTEKGYRVGVLEAGARFADASTADHGVEGSRGAGGGVAGAPEDDGVRKLPRTSWRLRDFLFAPRLGCLGIQRITLLRDVLVLSGAGVGGGSLVYANTLYEPLAEFYDDPQWRGLTDWRAELAPHYDQAKRMLGVTVNPTMTPSDVVMRKIAEEMGVGDTFRQTPVGVFFGRPGTPPGTEVDDPYFGGAGPRRRSCIECGECMTGCRHNAKNTLTTNYLYLAEEAGAKVHPLTTVTAVRPLAGGGYAVDTEPTRGGRPRRDRLRGDRARQTFHADQVVFAAGALGTQRLLHRMKAEGRLPHLSDRLGVLTRTNSESILGAIAKGRETDYSRGVAISSSFHPDPHTHIEPVRYGKGSNAMGLLQTVLTDGGDGSAGSRRWVTWLRQAARHPGDLARLANLRHWSERTVIALVMQSLDNSLTVRLRRGVLGWRLTSRQGHGEPNPTWIPVANQVVRRLAELVGGTPGGTLGEVVDMPITAHIIGGCVIGADAGRGVVDGYQRVYGHPGLHVLDGAAVSANLGVNPSLTITAQAERAVAYWPNRGEADPRPELGGGYQRIEPVAPRRPVVPASAPGALRLTSPRARRG
ncbi:cholesterol oxidase [Actinopolymorpha cephalotaxi]|uniref:Cholesterol oxidase n=1 Tax=Actinopolymorpha cephalotaxi TaxID=504797 RepID=A0A1I2KUG8_9ACTN|nr:GMC family oxidoreductase [Actinopolymorpha cephalotaxi]NYH84685.1 cholesterol oxidase [Actinopolymorpha cephalotaxi]SFF70732.1 cholesterol oxidase [Actinopolymorpha cephalotaxi]